jgi:hypothetical protein
MKTLFVSLSLLGLLVAVASADQPVPGTKKNANTWVYQGAEAATLSGVLSKYAQVKGGGAPMLKVAPLSCTTIVEDQSVSCQLTDKNGKKTVETPRAYDKDLAADSVVLRQLMGDAYQALGKLPPLTAPRHQITQTVKQVQCKSLPAAPHSVGRWTCEVTVL